MLDCLLLLCRSKAMGRWCRRYVITVGSSRNDLLMSESPSLLWELVALGWWCQIVHRYYRTSSNMPIMSDNPLLLASTVATDETHSLLLCHHISDGTIAADHLLVAIEGYVLFVQRCIVVVYICKSFDYNFHLVNCLLERTKLRKQLVSTFVWLWWVIDVPRFEFESGVSVVICCYLVWRIMFACLVVWRWQVWHDGQWRE
jgi:hypothetical protein